MDSMLNFMMIREIEVKDPEEKNTRDRVERRRCYRELLAAAVWRICDDVSSQLT